MSPVRPLLLRAIDREPVERPPIWFMRQAGRCLPEYRELRAKAGGFLKLCMNPETAAEVTLQPMRLRRRHRVRRHPDPADGDGTGAVVRSRRGTAVRAIASAGSA